MLPGFIDRKIGSHGTIVETANPSLCSVVQFSSISLPYCELHLNIVSCNKLTVARRHFRPSSIIKSNLNEFAPLPKEEESKIGNGNAHSRHEIR